MEDQLLFFSPNADTPLPHFSRYLKHKAKRFQALCWCDAAFKVAGFEGKAELSRPTLPLRLPKVGQNPVICLIPRNSFEEVFRHYTGSSPSVVVIGLEVKGQIKHLSSDFDRYCRLVPQNLSSLLTTFVREKVDELISEKFESEGPKATLDKMENEVNALIDRVVMLKDRLETVPLYSLLLRVKQGLDSQLKGVNERLYRLKEVYEKTRFPDIYLQPLADDNLLVINWLKSPIVCRFQIYCRDVTGRVEMCESDEKELMPGIHKLDLHNDHYELGKVKVKNRTKVLSNTANFMDLVNPSAPNLNLLNLLNRSDHQRGYEPNSATLPQQPRLH